MNFTKELVSPERAKELLEGNINNRKPKMPVIKRYMEEMKAGKWKENTGECIKIAKSGRILDGQQRLMAIIQSKVSINLHIATNLEEDIFDVLDTGTRRSTVDVFHIEGIKYASSIPSIITFFEDLNNGYSQRNNHKHLRLTNCEILAKYKADELFWQMIVSTTHTWYLQFAKILQPSVIGGFYAFFHAINPEAAHNFMEQITTGANITNGSIKALRQRLLEDKVSLLKMKFSYKTALIIKTWNYFRTNQEVKAIKYDAGKEEFPKPILN